MVGIKPLMMFGKKDIFLHFLLHLNEDFDDDLLFDAITILDWINMKFLHLSLFIFFVYFLFRFSGSWREAPRSNSRNNKRQIKSFRKVIVESKNIQSIIDQPQQNPPPLSSAELSRYHSYFSQGLSFSYWNRISISSE